MTHRLKRRELLLGAASLALAQGGLAAADSGPSKPVLVFVFLRGAMDGLSAVVPYRERSYYEQRGSIAIPAPGKGPDAAIDLDGHFGLHPALTPLLAAYKSGELALVHAVGSPSESRSHFDAQDFMELGTPGRKLGDGWLSRVTRALSTSDPSPAFALEEPLPRSLDGEPRALAMSGLEVLRADRQGVVADSIRSGFAHMYQGDAADAVRGTGASAFALLSKLEPLIDTPPRAQYPEGEELGAALADVARLVRAGLGSVFTLSTAKWDTHRRQGASEGVLAKRFGALARSLAAFRQDLGADIERTLVLVVTEFGRTVRQNGTGGTDHGHGSAMFALGGKVRGGKVYGKWPGLAEDQLYQGRDLAVTTDFRDVFAEVATRHLGVSDAATLFPDYPIDGARALGLVG